MNVFKKAKEDGLSLRLMFVLMLVVSLSITAILLLTTYRTIRSFHALSESTEAYIELEAAASSLLSASDYLTDEAQCYVVLAEREHLDNYFTEADTTRRRERALETMESYQPDSEALTALKGAMAESVSLMTREYYAMRLTLDALGDTDIPAVLRETVLSAEDAALSADGKLALARRMMHDEGYYSQKNRIRAQLQACIEELKGGTRSLESLMEQRMRLDLVWMTVLIILQSVAIVTMLWLTTSLGINPLLQAVEHIKHDQSLPIIGAHEFRYLAGTYNTMYIVYKKSIRNLSFKASHDELTGVYNRAGYDLIKQSVDVETTAFLLFDADRFKLVNDRHGHEVGDRVLKRIADTLRQNFRADDYICRIGGDEFIVLMVHVDTNVKRLIKHKVKQVNADLSEATAEGLPATTMSAGVALYHDGADAQQLFHEADIALYYIKNNGRNGCCFYAPGMIDTIS